MIDICQIETDDRNWRRADMLFKESESMYEWNVRVSEDKVLEFIGLHNFDLMEFVVQSHKKMRIITKKEMNDD